MARSGMVNVGQLARQEWGDDDVVLVGFSSYRGSVIAGEEWGAPMERMPVPPARDGSWEAIFHEAGAEDRLVLTDDLAGAERSMDAIGHRAIGVVYNPGAERWGNYVPTVLPLRYDAVLYIDETSALRPLHLELHETGEPAETFPSGM